MSAVSFSALGVADPLVSALVRSGINEPFPIQAATLPDAIAGRDILARGQTGSGKTLAFGLAVLSRLRGRTAQPKRPMALILVPTRELAMQVKDTLSPLGDSVDVQMRLVVGGMAYSKQIQAISRGVHLIVATPGRLIDLVERGDVELSQVSITVLDEADQMADMGFLPAMREILDMTKPNSQRLLFSATLDRDVDTLVRSYLNDPARHSLQSSNADVSTMEHHVFVVHPNDKDTITAQIGARDGRTLFFVRTQRAVDQLAGRLAEQGIATGALHGGKSQAVRTRTLESFREGLTTALVATDVAARGIHIDGIDLVVHVDAPQDSKDYVHRAGRTARAGESGTVVTLTYPRQQRNVATLTGRAGVKPNVIRVRPGTQDLIDITGAREPSGVAWIEPISKRDRSGRKPRQQRNHRSSEGSRPRRSRDEQTSRSRGADGASSRTKPQRSDTNSYARDTDSAVGKSRQRRSDTKSDTRKIDGAVGKARPARTESKSYSRNTDGAVGSSKPQRSGGYTRTTGGSTGKAKPQQGEYKSHTRSADKGFAKSKPQRSAYKSRSSSSDGEFKKSKPQRSEFTSYSRGTHSSSSNSKAQREDRESASKRDRSDRPSTGRKPRHGTAKRRAAAR